MPRLPELRGLRERANLTQHELAERSRVGRTTIAGLESGRRNAQPKTVRKLADALGVEPAALYSMKHTLGLSGPGALTTIYEHTHDGWWVVSVPEIPGAHSQGRTREEAREMIQDAVRLLLEVRREDAEREASGASHEVIRETLEV